MRLILFCFFAFYFGITIKCATDVDLSDLVQYQSCVKNYTAQNPDLAKRFSLYQITKSCKRFDNWHKELQDVHVNKTTVTRYSPLQQKYVDRIQYCRNYMDCYGDTIPKRTPFNRTETRMKRQATLANRRECRTLSLAELQNYFNTLNRLKNSMIDSSSKFDLIIQYHLPSSAPEAHFGPAFLPYHRELLKQLEVAGRRENPSFSLCYWDSRLDYYLPNPADSVLWMDEIFGNGNGYVTSGPFANWATTVSIPGADQRRLFRQVGRSNSAGLYNYDDINRLLTKNSFEEFCSYCRDPTFEILHGGVHDFVGGYMTYIPASPNDPTFFSHHTFIDYFWEVWRQTRQNPLQQETDYPTDGRGACGVQYYANSQMRPFSLRNIEGLSNSYMSLYSYSNSPTCESGCGGLFLFCNTQTNRCMSKVRPGGNCAGLENFDSCYNSICSGGRCGQSAVQVQQRPEIPRTTIPEVQRPVVQSPMVQRPVIQSPQHPPSNFIIFGRRGSVE